MAAAQRGVVCGAFAQALSAVALKCGITPIATLMLDGAFSHRNYGLNDIDGVDYVHGLSHGEIAGIAADHPRWVKITTHFFEHFAYLLQQMDAVNEGAGTMLDNSIVYISSEFGDGNGHSIKQLPVLIAGSGGGRLKTAQQLAVADNTPSATPFWTWCAPRGSSGRRTATAPDRFRASPSKSATRKITSEHCGAAKAVLSPRDDARPSPLVDDSIAWRRRGLRWRRERTARQ